MITRWINALANFAAGFAAASVLFLLAPSKGDTHDSDEDIETLEGELEKERKALDRLEETAKELEKELEAIEKELDNIGRLAAGKANKNGNE